LIFGVKLINRFKQIICLFFHAKLLDANVQLIDLSEVIKMPDPDFAKWIPLPQRF
jgi:hypothetical protein